MFPLDNQSQIQPDDTALLFDKTVWSFRELASAVDALAEWLLSFSVNKSLRIGIVASASDRYAIAMLAGWKCGACLCPFPTNWATHEIISEIKQAHLDLLFCDDAFVEELSLETKLPVYRLEDLRFDSVTKSTKLILNRHDQAALEIYTSGSGGKSKRVHLSWTALDNHAKMSEQHLQYSAQDRWLITLPLFHIGGVSTLVKSLVTGFSVHIENGFDAARVNELVESGTITLLSLVPTTLNRLLEYRAGRALPVSIKFILLGGGAASQKLLEQDSRFLASYGMSEAGSQITTIPPGSDESLRYTSGLPLPGVVIEIRGETGNVLPLNEIGEIYVKSPALADGYADDSEETENRFVEGWLRTGDYGRLTERGALVVEGRREDRIISGGENIHPAEIERVVQTHNAVKQAFVLGIPDSEWGQIVAVVVEIHNQITEEELSNFLRTKIASYKIPKRWWLVAEIPHLPNGKPDRHRITNHFITNT